MCEVLNYKKYHEIFAESSADCVTLSGGGGAVEWDISSLQENVGYTGQSLRRHSSCLWQGFRREQLKSISEKSGVLVLI